MWNTCMVFFQVVLLAGYLYAHRSTGKFGVQRQAIFHLILLVAVLVAFKAAMVSTPNGSPLAVLGSFIPDDSDNPVLGLVALLTIAVGVPFFVLTTSSPLLQRWFAATGHPSAKDPYFLYAASNAGSLLGLLGYPLLLEPRLTLWEQQWVFAVAVMIYISLVVICALIVIRSQRKQCNVEDQFASQQLRLCTPELAPEGEQQAIPLSKSRIVRWVFLAALPSSLLLGVTTHVSANLAPVPLLWAVPLSLYLISFILVFARWPNKVHQAIGRLTPVLLLLVVLSLLLNASEPFALIGLLHMGAFFGVCLVCHGELARDRPPAEHLTAFYFWMSLGGVIGGVLNGLVAPIIFHKLGMVEYPLVLVLAGAVRPRCDASAKEPPLRIVDVLVVLTLLGISVGLVLFVSNYVVSPIPLDEPETWQEKLVRGGLMFGLPAAATALLVHRPKRYALCLGALFVAGAFDVGRLGETLHMERNFYGVLRVARSPDGKFVRLIHGTTIHGQQRIDEPGPPRPMTYYYEWGPVGRLFQDLSQRNQQLKRVAVVGLGTGTVAYYAQPGQQWTFFEIDPAVARIAQNPEYFRFLSSCKADSCEIVLGDARRQLTRRPNESFDLIILDGFCSDSMPVHLLTREAFTIYLQKLTPGGVLAVNVTNPHLDLAPMIARIANSFEEPLAVRIRHDQPTETTRAEGKSESSWMILARNETSLGPVGWDPYWDGVTPTEGQIWQDDFANLLAAWKPHRK